MKTPSFKQSILLVGTPAILAVGGLSAMAASAPTPKATPAPQTQRPAEPAETAETADATLPGGGHADAAGQIVDDQFEGVE
jgi:hypothetical protein